MSMDYRKYFTGFGGGWTVSSHNTNGWTQSLHGGMGVGNGDAEGGGGAGGFPGVPAVPGSASDETPVTVAVAGEI